MPLTCRAANPNWHYSKAFAQFSFKCLKMKSLLPRPNIEKCFRRETQQFSHELFSLLLSHVL